MQQNKPLADHEGIVANEWLPYPYVYYPDFYGIFFAFGRDKKSSLKMCSCSRGAVMNYLSIILLHNENDYIYDEIRIVPEGKLILDDRFPAALKKKFSRKRGYTPNEILEKIDFQPQLCHECNNATPAYLYCPGAYGSSFKQNYGWYINKISLDYGIYEGHVYFPELCPSEIIKFVEIPRVIDGKINVDSYHWKTAEKVRAQRDKVERAIENIVRLKYGHKQIGDQWTNETILYRIVCALFPSESVQRHFKPKFLRGLELDIFLPEKKVGIEYQGIQHYQPFDHWGGTEAFERLQERDAKKKRLCAANKVKLIYFDYKEGLSSKYVAEKLKDYL